MKKKKKPEAPNLPYRAGTLLPENVSPNRFAVIGHDGKIYITQEYIDAHAQYIKDFAEWEASVSGKDAKEFFGHYAVSSRHTWNRDRVLCSMCVHYVKKDESKGTCSLGKFATRYNSTCNRSKKVGEVS